MVRVPEPAVLDPWVWGQDVIPFDVDPTVTNSEDVITDLWIQARIEAGSRVAGSGRRHDRAVGRRISGARCPPGSSAGRRL